MMKPVHTYTIVWDESQSTPANMFVRYEDDATGMTQGSSDWDTIFGYSGVRLASDGTESARVSQSSPGVLDITQLGDLTTGDNVMIKLPVRGVKMSKSGTQITLSITDGLGMESDGFQYYAFQKTGDVDANTSSSVETKPLYLGAYIGQAITSLSPITIKSWAGSSSSTCYNLANTLTYAGNNGTGWTIMGWYQWCLVNAYYMMKYGNPDSKTVVGLGVSGTGKSNMLARGGTNGYTSATWGENTGKYQMKLFGLEDWWGNAYCWLGGNFTDSSKNVYVALHDFTANMSTSETQYKSIGSMSPSNGYCIKTVSGTNKGMFGPLTTQNNSSFNTYYSASAGVYASRVFCSGGNGTERASVGAFRVFGNQAPTSTSYTTLGRLMYL